VLAKSKEVKMDKTYIEVKQVKSTIGQSKAQRLIMKSLGLTKIGKLKTLNDTKAIRGMVVKVQHLIEVKVKILES